MKRFSDTARFEEPWYRQLPSELKIAWEFVWARCDNAGVWWPDFPLADFMLGCKVKWDELREKTGRVVVLPSGKWLLKGFVELQCGAQLSPDSRPHQAVMKLLDFHGICLSDSLSIVYPVDYQEGTDTPKDKDKEQDPDPDKPPRTRESDNKPTSPEALRVAAIVGRRPTTAWTATEISKYRQLLKAGQLTDEHLALLESYYTAEKAKGKDGYHRRDLTTFLNNFAGELDRANAPKTTPSLSTRRGVNVNDPNHKPW